MNVFLVDAGKLFTLDQTVLSKRVQDLQFILSDLADIPLDKQVLLTYNGRALDSSHQIYHYTNSFSTEQPVFLFSKSNIECNVLQPFIQLPQDMNLQERLERYLKDTQTCETLKFGADLAVDYHKHSENILARTRQLVQDQEFQRSGWNAVINNLDSVTAGFDKRVVLFHELYDSFLTNKDKYSSMLLQFDEDVKILSKIPLTKGIVDQMKETKMIDSIRCSQQHGLGITESMRAPDPGESPTEFQNLPVQALEAKKGEFISLLHWIEAQDSQNSLNSLVLQCSRAMDQINIAFQPRVQEEVDKVKQSLQAPGMRDIKGLEERLQQLKTLLGQTERMCEEQANNANTIRNQQESFMIQGDISVLSDLLVAHREQLKRLHTNNRSLVEFYNKFAAAKAELSQNLLIRLNWVTHCQKSIWTCDGRLTMISENLVRVKRRFAILEQINIAPVLYCKCLGEVSRRTNFTSTYKAWGKGLVDSVEKHKKLECGKRSFFQERLHGHFLTTLFRGLDSTPPSFASDKALSFDEDLFPVSEEELQQISELFPDYKHLLLPIKSDIKEDEDEIKLSGVTPLTSSGNAKEGTRAPERMDTDSDKSAQELAVQLSKNLKLEVKLDVTKEQIKTLESVTKELEDNLLAAQEKLENKVTLENRISDLTKELDVLTKECSSFQTLAYEKETKIGVMKTENESLKCQQRGLKMEKANQETQIKGYEEQIVSYKKTISEGEEALIKLQRDLDLLNSDETVSEQHARQLDNLAKEIEQKKDKERLAELQKKEKEHNYELEKLKLEKDKAFHELETKTKLRYGEIEKAVENLTDDNSKLVANMSALQKVVQDLKKENADYKKEAEEEREMGAMSRAESERDAKLLKQNTAVELDELRCVAAKKETELQGRIRGLQGELESARSYGSTPILPQNGSSSSSTVTSTSSTSSPDYLLLQELVKKQAQEIEGLKTVKSRCVQVAMTQFQKGDTVLFYYDDQKSNYLIANISPNEYQYFLHPDNLHALHLSLDDPLSRKPWQIGVIKDKEFCQARKVNNRFKVPEGRKFYRVYAQPLPKTHSQQNATGSSTSFHYPDE